MARPLNYSTKIPARVTVGQCTHMLADAGASAVATMYEAKVPTGLSFRLATPQGERDFTLPVNTDGAAKMMYDMLTTDPPKVGSTELNRLRSRQHATDVAWRVVKDWLEAQLALIAAGMAQLDEVMLPYLQIEGRTLYQRYADRLLPALES